VRTRDLERWLEGRGANAKLGRGRSPDFGSSRVTIMPTPGFAMSVEGAIDRPTYQLVSYGTTFDAAEDLAYRMDRLIVPPPGFGQGQYDAVYPAVLGPAGEEYRVLAAGRVGGGPAPISVDPTNGHTQFSCNYWFSVER
jgi:hypothetical protein